MYKVALNTFWHIASMDGISFDPTFGALFLGFIFSCIISGIITFQTYLYFHYFPKDLLRIKLVDVVHLLLQIHAFYHSLKGAIGQPSSILDLGHIKISTVTLVHSFYTHRLWSSKQNSPCFAASLIEFRPVGATGIPLSYTLPSFAQVDSIKWAIRTTYATATSIDLILTSATCYYLYKSKGTFRGFNSKMSKMIQFTLGSGLLTLSGSFVVLMTTFLPRSLVFVGIGFITSELYIISYFSMINARKRVRKEELDQGSFEST
ncbi:hypothetical protein BD779DRAFT_1507611 [Infundibulicybe gibba]|nr:hypothetical protein BD779DRAFT_1507611 [Infundibulicybe gibba]